MLYYGFSDHLGSTSITTNASGAKIAEMRYKAWGEIRYSSGDTHTDKSYTGQRSYTDDFGLMFYNARWYDTTIGRFAQADSIVPGGVQGFDRYAYTSNNPVNRTDPSGHIPGVPCDVDNSSGCTKSNKPVDQPGCGVAGGTYGFHCTKQDMDNASLSQRQKWFFWLPGMMTELLKNNAGDMFGNISTVVAGFSATGQDDNQWARDIDAAILLSAQDGFANSLGLYQGEVTAGDGVDKWTKYFSAFKKPGTTKQQLIELWGNAEQQATQEGMVAYGQPADLDDQAFLFIGNIYRNAGSTICKSQDCTTFAWGFFSPDTRGPLGFSPVGFALIAVYSIDTAGYAFTGH